MSEVNVMNGDILMTYLSTRIIGMLGEVGHIYKRPGNNTFELFELRILGFKLFFKVFS